MKRSKAYQQALEKIEEDKIYSPMGAIKIIKDTVSTKFDPTLDVSMCMGVDPRKADQMVRGTVNLPHGTGKTSRVLVFAGGEKADEAREAGADFVGADDMLGKVLGPRGLMPNPKTGTVTMDVVKAVGDIKGGKIEFRLDKHANMQFPIGKASFTADQLNDNFAAVMDEINRMKPSAAKGRYIKKATLSSTMGPGIPIDPAKSEDDDF